MSYIDYSKTGIFDRHNSDLTKEKNKELYAMYEAYYEKIQQKKTLGFEPEKYNSIQLLTCFKSYLAADNQIMIYGQEANTDEGCVLDDLSPHYQKKDESDEYYKYEYKIAHVGEKGIPKSKCRQTEYLKTRELIARFDKKHEPEEREAEILSVLSNNLNKSSIGGNYTLSSDMAIEYVYSENLSSFEMRIAEPVRELIQHRLNQKLNECDSYPSTYSRIRLHTLFSAKRKNIFSAPS